MSTWITPLQTVYYNFMSDVSINSMWCVIASTEKWERSDSEVLIFQDIAPIWGKNIQFNAALQITAVSHTGLIVNMLKQYCSTRNTRGPLRLLVLLESCRNQPCMNPERKLMINLTKIKFKSYLLKQIIDLKNKTKKRVKTDNNKRN